MQSVTTMSILSRPTYWRQRSGPKVSGVSDILQRRKTASIFAVGHCEVGHKPADLVVALAAGATVACGGASSPSKWSKPLKEIKLATFNARAEAALLRAIFDVCYFAPNTLPNNHAPR